MFDYHMHSSVSFDSKCPPEDIVLAAENAGLKEICFTDHYDYNDVHREKCDMFTMEQYRAGYDGLHSDRVTIRHGVEFGLTPWNRAEFRALLDLYDFDFAIGSVHSIEGVDACSRKFWAANDAETAFEKYLLQTLECVKAHDGFDVLGHLNYVCKSGHNAEHKPLRYQDYRDICDEIMKILAENGRGLEINTSGVDKVGDFLPTIDFLQRFRELGGEIVTVGTDAHTADRVGQYIPEALALAKEVFGHVCTYEKRKPVFHKL